MADGGRGTYLIPWSQTWIDGLSGAPVSALEPGVHWRWSGDAVCLDRAPDVLVLRGSDGEAETRRRAARAVRRIVGRAMPPVMSGEREDPDEPLFDRSFVLTDGRRRYTATMIDMPEISRPLLMFLGGVPPVQADLWVVSCAGAGASLNRMTEEPTGVICFTPGTFLNTPSGPKLVEELAEGDVVSTKDDGPQEILWVGSRRMSGARLFAMPELRPVRIRAGAVNGTLPAPDLLVSPQHRVLLQGRVAEALFNTPEVLVAARDLIDDRGILIDHQLREVTYIHLLLPRHEVVWANGVETESFHPASTDLATIAEDQRARLLRLTPGIDADPHSYGAAARRTLSTSEAAIFGAEGRL